MPDIIATVVLGHSNQIPGREEKKKDCICCPGFPSHVHHVGTELNAFPSRYPSHFPRDLDNWLYSTFDLKHLEGRKIRITAELLPIEDENHGT